MVIRGGESIYPPEIEELLYELTTEKLLQFCTGKLAHYKIPRYVHIVEEFPMTVSGKVRKVQMGEESVQLLGLQDAAAAGHA